LQVAAINALSSTDPSIDAKRVAETFKRVDHSQDNPEDYRPTIGAANVHISDLLLGNDMLINNDLADEMLAIGKALSNHNLSAPPSAEEHARVKRQLIKLTSWGGSDLHRRWDVNKSIAYTFSDDIDEYTKHLVRLAAEFWTGMTCVTWEENGPNNPKVQFFKGQGCYSDVGRDRGRPFCQKLINFIKFPCISRLLQVTAITHNTCL